MKKIVSYNINGIRASLRKGIDKWMLGYNPDIVCLQEIKANEQQFNVPLFNEIGYNCYLNPATKPGYSGVAILSKEKPLHVEYGCGIHEIDQEGRLIRLDFSNFSIMSVYFPSGSSGEIRQNFKIRFLDFFLQYIISLSKTVKKLIISGDFNICHKSIDIHNPTRNKNTSGFLPEERDWIDSLIELGFIDTFRYFNIEPHNYSWWSYRANSRANNKGWRIDYNMVSKSIEESIVNASILSDVHHSDHCPIKLELSL